MTLARLFQLYARPAFIIYFVFEYIIIICLFATARYAAAAQADESFKAKSLFKTMTQSKLTNLTGAVYAITGGTIASQTILLAKSCIDLVGKGLSQLFNQSAFFVLIVLVITAVAQVSKYCYNLVNF